MTQRLSQPSLQRYQKALQGVIAAVHDSRQRYASCRGLKPRLLAGTSRFMKELLALPESSDYSLFEMQLKRRLVRISHRLHGIHREEQDEKFALLLRLPTEYHDAIHRYDDVARQLLKSLSDVDIKSRHEPLKGVRTVLG